MPSTKVGPDPRRGHHHSRLEGKGSKRRVPCAQRVIGMLEMRRAEATSEWVFPRDTASGHVEASTLKKQHAATIPVVQRLAGHTDIGTTMRYVHLNDDDVRAAMAREQEEKGGHTFRHTEQDAASGAPN